MACLKSRSGEVYSEMYPQLWFDSRKPNKFDEFYSSFKLATTAEKKLLTPRRQAESDCALKLQLSTKLTDSNDTYGIESPVPTERLNMDFTESSARPSIPNKGLRSAGSSSRNLYSASRP